VLPCINCLICIDNFAFGHKAVTCSVNAAAARDSHTIDLRPAAMRKKVLIVGGGAAGLEAARVAATRGHSVTICDAAEKLGGMMLLAAIPPNKSAIREYVDFLARQMERLKVDVRLGQEVKPEVVEKMGMDAVIVATGAIPIVPNIPGLDMARAHFAVDVLAGKVTVGNTVIIIGGGMVGCETAELLVESGRTVTIIEVLPRLAGDAIPYKRAPLVSYLKAKGVSSFTAARPHEVTTVGMKLTDANGVLLSLVADTILMAGGFRPDRRLYDALKGNVTGLHLAGDALKQGTIQSAVASGYDIAMSL
jgi:2-enoate reductase